MAFGLGMRQGGAGGTLSGAPATNWSAAFGGIPGVPSPIGSASAALGGNIANLGQIYGLTGGLNASLAGQQRGQLGAGLPGYADLVSQSAGNIGAALKGVIPGDVKDILIRDAAERGIMMGTSDAPINDTAYLATLGQTSLGQQRYGEQALTGAIARTPMPQLVRPESFLVTPEQQQEAQYAANVLRAAPIPAAAAGAGLGAAARGYNQGVGGISSPHISNPFAPANPFVADRGGFGGPMVSASSTATGYAPNIAASWQDWERGLPQYTSDTNSDDPYQGMLSDVDASIFGEE